MFDNCRTNTKQGDLGEARAIYEYTKMGFVVSKPLCDSEKYDLIVDDGEELRKVQVKTCRFKPKNKDKFEVYLATSGGNTKENIKRKPQEGDYDELFILTESDECWIIPACYAVGKGSITVGTAKYAAHKL